MKNRDKVRIFNGYRFVCLAPGRWTSPPFVLALHGKEWKLWQRSKAEHANFHFYDENGLPLALRTTRYVRLRTGVTMKDAAQGLLTL